MEAAEDAITDGQADGDDEEEEEEEEQQQQRFVGRKRAMDQSQAWKEMCDA